MNFLPRSCLAFFSICLLAVPSLAQPQGVDRLRTELLAGQSATQILAGYCSTLGLASPPVIRALRDNVKESASAEVRGLLKADPDEDIRYRRVHLMCGNQVLSDADNWYVPDRLTPEMNKMLDQTDTPFGTAVLPLEFHRQTLSTSAINDPKVILRITALLLTKADKPFSLVIESYRPVLIAQSGQK
jgi:hypothetical protein